MRKAVYSFTMLLIASLTLAQQSLHTKSKKAIQLYQQAYELDSIGNYFQSEPLIREALKKDDSFDEAHLLLFMTLMKKSNVNGAIGVQAGAAEKVDDDINNRMLLELATFFWSNGRYPEALKLKEQVGEKVYNTTKETADLVKASIDLSSEGQKNPLNINFQELPTPMNPFPSQYFPSLTSAGDLVFTGRSRGRRGENEDLFVSRLEGKKWTIPESLSDSINTPNLNEGTASISADGLSIVFTGCNRPEGFGSCDLYASYLVNDEWTIPENLGDKINTQHWESQPSLSQDGRQMFFVSTMPGGLGGQDVWRSYKIDGVWTKAENLGATINTNLDDCSPYIHPNGETLFYASRGRVGFGGYDLFKTEEKEGAWTEPENLGFPINSFENQVGYTLGLDGWAYYSDNNLMGQTKLYRFKMPESLLPEVKLSLFKGLVQNADSKEPLIADIFLTDLISDSTVVQTHSKKNGNFSFIPPDLEKNYMVYAEQTGYRLYKNELSSIKKEAGEYIIELSPLKVGDRIILNNILFDLNSAALDSKAKEELEIATGFLMNNPNVTVEIGGHTDAVGDEDYNLTLSTSRAKTVYDYLISKGVLSTRLSFKGYGESQPIERNVESGENAINRRIELRVIKL